VLILFSLTTVVERISSKASQGLPGSIKGFLTCLSDLIVGILSELLTLHKEMSTF